MLFSFSPACQTVSPSEVWRPQKWAIKKPYKFAKSSWTPLWEMFFLLMVCRLDWEYVINERDYTQPLLTGLWFDTAQFSCAIQADTQSLFPLFSSFPYPLISWLVCVCLPWLCFSVTCVFECVLEIILRFSNADIRFQNKVCQRNNRTCSHTEVSAHIPEHARRVNNVSILS